MALKQGVSIPTSQINGTDYRITGKNQFKLVAETQMIADLPVDYKIKEDFKAQAEV